MYILLGGEMIFAEGLISGGGGGGGGYQSSSNVGIAVAVTAMAGLALAVALVYSRRGGLSSHWLRRRRKHALLPKQWKFLFDADGRFFDGGVKFLKKVRSGGIDPTLRAQVWPFLLGLYELNSSKEERDLIRTQKREEYDDLRKQCIQMSKRIIDINSMSKETCGNKFSEENSGEFSEVVDPPHSPQEVSLEEDTPSHADCSPICKISDKLSEKENNESEIITEKVSGESSEVVDPPHSPQEVSDEEETSSAPHKEHNGPSHADCSPIYKNSNKLSEKEDNESEITSQNASEACSESSDSDSTNELDNTKNDQNDLEDHNQEKFLNHEDFATWQRIIRLDAVRANAEWIVYSPSQSSVSETKARELADSVCLKDYDHLEPYRIFHAARLVAILEAYSLLDPEIGYCQGMSDLLSPIISVIEDDSDAFWCFVGFMKKARHNFRLDEVGIRRQLGIVSKIIKYKDSHLYSHLEKLEAQDCFFVYRMVVVLFRRELNLEQIFCLWEVMWADQASIRAGISRSSWGRMKVRAPPSDDLLLYAIAACVLQKRKLIIEKYTGMDEIMRECNSMAGRLDVWKLLDDAHDLVAILHDKI